MVEERATAGGLTLKTRFAADIPGLRADERMVKQMVINLLSNAVKYTPEGGRIRLDVARGRAGTLTITVADTGIGLAPEEIPVALMPFRQIDSSLSRKHGGTGLGLPLVKSLVELHGGGVSIESRQSVGTTVTLTFPAVRVIEASAEMPADPEAAHPIERRTAPAVGSGLIKAG